MLAGCLWAGPALVAAAPPLPHTRLRSTHLSAWASCPRLLLGFACRSRFSPFLPYPRLNVTESQHSKLRFHQWAHFAPARFFGHSTAIKVLPLILTLSAYRESAPEIPYPVRFQ